MVAPYAITVQQPDDFLVPLVPHFSSAVRDTLEEMRLRKTRPPLSQADQLAKLANQRLPKFVAALAATGYGHPT